MIIRSIINSLICLAFIMSCSKNEIAFTTESFPYEKVYKLLKGNNIIVHVHLNQQKIKECHFKIEMSQFGKEGNVTVTFEEIGINTEGELLEILSSRIMNPHEDTYDDKPITSYVDLFEQLNFDLFVKVVPIINQKDSLLYDFLLSNDNKIVISFEKY